MTTAPLKPSIAPSRDAVGIGSDALVQLPTCMHTMGHYVWRRPGSDRGDIVKCGKRATHVANYPNSDGPFYLCRKHSKTRLYLSELNTTMSQPGGQA